MSHVAPALAELNELVEERGLLRNYGPQALGAGTTAAGMFAGVNAMTGNIAAAGVGTVAALGLGAAQGAEKRRAVKRTMRANPYFFLHDTEDRLAR